MDILILAGIVVVAIFALGLIMARLYRRASKELSFVRTGMGGQKVIINGGALVLPILHEIIPVNMNTLRLEVRRANEQALITHDRMRVDVTAEFYVRAKPTADSIANAAQTLGLKTTRPDELKVLVEGKFVDALRAVAAEMAMEELHEKRVDFVQKVQQVVSEDLLKNGLELESVSLTGLDQTSVQHFNPRNAFDAEGLTRLTQAIESRRKTRNDIEQDTEVEVRTKNLGAERLKLDISRDQEYAQLSQSREIAIRKADQSAEIAIEEASKNRNAQEAEIQAKRQVEIANIDAERTVEEQRIAMQQAVNNREIERDRLVDTARIEQKKTIELADQDRTIAVAERSKAQSEAERAANQARSAAVREEERVATARDVEVADRVKQVELVDARKAAERDAIAIEVKAEAKSVPRPINRKRCAPSRKRRPTSSGSQRRVWPRPQSCRRTRLSGDTRSTPKASGAPMRPTTCSPTSRSPCRSAWRSWSTCPRSFGRASSRWSGSTASRSSRSTAWAATAAATVPRPRAAAIWPTKSSTARCGTGLRRPCSTRCSASSASTRRP